ncbi:MAG TPA: tRNA (5-methylaminomethyl-2-thiouridine)(34)-methyltransferase MnmD [Gammaproteobacteria bacterium]|nr:tRNA (5-methylaminomethyl-2-thiouridine)(34)-methyltransferase MnmD [Gammaproteobacteria bacterium]
MDTHKIALDKGALRSTQYDDIFFNPEKALEEIKHVFANNQLTQCWQGIALFTLAETGFGTGLNCLMAWDLFEKTGHKNGHLHILSIDKYPLHKTDLIKALAPFYPQLGSKIDRLIETYPLIIKGEHRLWLSSNVSLTLIFDDCSRALSLLNQSIDAWFLDGFSPSKNPEMWSNEIFQNMARLSHDQTIFTTFTAAGMVKRGLRDNGFIVEKVPGFDQKKHRLQGNFTQRKRPKSSVPTSVAVVGAGLAGAACAYTFAKHNVTVDIFDQNPQAAMNTSSHNTLLLNPKPHVQPTHTNNLITQGFNLTLKHINDLKKNNPITTSRQGNIHLANTAIKLKRFNNLIKAKNWHHEHMHMLSSKEASDLVGIQLNHTAMLYPDAGQFSPRELVNAYLNHPNIQTHFNHLINTNKALNQNSSTLQDLCQNYDKVILCNGFSAQKLLHAYQHTPPMIPTRGQTTHIRFKNICLNHAISHGGICTATNNLGIATIGPTFDTSRETPDILPEDNDFNVQQLISSIPSLNHTFQVIGQWSGIRTTTRTRDPIYGHIGDNLYASLALGSHGATLHSVLADKVFLESIKTD